MNSQIKIKNQNEICQNKIYLINMEEKRNSLQKIKISKKKRKKIPCNRLAKSGLRDMKVRSTRYGLRNMEVRS